MSELNSGNEATNDTSNEAVSNFIAAATADANKPGEVDPLTSYLAKYDQDVFAEEAKQYLDEPVEQVDEAVDNEKPPENTNSPDPFKEAEARLLAREESVRKLEADFENRVKEATSRRLDFRGKKADEVLKALGYDPELVMKEMMYERASDTNPVKAKLREELRDIHTKRELDSMRLELEQAKAYEAQRQYFQSVDTGAREYVATKVDEKVTPIFAEVAKTKPELAHQRVMQVILEDARERLARGEDGDPLSYAEAVKRAEAGWAELAGVFRTKVATDNAPNEVAAKGKPVLKKPIVKPAPNMTPEDIIQAGIEKATKTFYMTEAKARGLK